MSIWASLGWHKKNPLLGKIPMREEYNGTVLEGAGSAHVGVAVTGWNEMIRLSIRTPDEDADVYLVAIEVAELIELLALSLQSRKS